MESLGLKNELTSCQELQTIRDVMRWAVSQFHQHQLVYAHGVDDVFSEAIWLVLGVLHLPLDTDQSWWESRLTEGEKRALHEALQQRMITRKPTAYILQEAWFMGLRFYVDERVLVPRSPTAELIEAQFSPWIEADKVTRILDLCCGSACIGIACAYAFPQAEIDLVDISRDALDVAEYNVKQHQLEKQVNIIQSDLFKALKKQRYDIIVSNPPYVDAEDMATLSAEHRHEPRLGLEAGGQGLDVVHRILRQASQYMHPEAILIVEVGNSAVALNHAYPHLAITWLDFENGGDGVFLLSQEQLTSL